MACVRCRPAARAGAGRGRRGYRLVVDARMIASSGIGRYLRSALGVIQREDIELVLLGDEAAIREGCPGLDCSVLPMGRSVYDPRSQLALARAVPECDVFFSPHVTTTRLAVPARRRILTVHDAFHLSPVAGFGPAKRLYSRFIYSSALSVSDLVMTDSEFTKAELARWFPRRVGKIQVVPIFVDPALFSPDSERSRTIQGDYLLFVGNLKPHKNLAAAVEAAKLLDPGMRVAVVGADTGFIHGLGQELAALRKDVNVVFLGRLDDEELRRLYSHALALVFPSLYEGFGYPPLEAMACGCPVVCSDIPVLRETCGLAALFCDPRSPSDLAQGLGRAIARGRERENLIEAGRARAAEFSRERFAASIRPIMWANMPTARQLR